MAAKGIPQPIIRLLVESRQLGGQDLRNLALTNLTMFRAVPTERKRYQIKWLAIAKMPLNPLRSAIAANSPPSLKEALELAEFDKDTTSLNGRNMHTAHLSGSRGVHELMRLCIKQQAVQCLHELLNWVSHPNTPFKYDPNWVYKTAARRALDRGGIKHLLLLHDLDDANHTLYGNPTEIYTLLLEHAVSPAAIHWLARRIPEKCFDYLPVLIAQLSTRFTTPALIEELIGFVVPRTHLSDAVCFPPGAPPRVRRPSRRPLPPCTSPRCASCCATARAPCRSPAPGGTRQSATRSRPRSAKARTFLGARRRSILHGRCPCRRRRWQLQG
jgi:hypothetical protein